MNTKMLGRLTLWIVPLALGFAVAPLQSQETDDEPLQSRETDEALWKKLDITKDGWLDGKELEGGWLKFDADGDKEVTKAEFLAGRAKERNASTATASPEDAAKVFKKLDASGNGYLSGTELDQGDVKSYDTNQDKRVTFEEFISGRAKEKGVGAATPRPKTAPEWHRLGEAYIVQGQDNYAFWAFARGMATDPTYQPLFDAMNRYGARLAKAKIVEPPTGTPAPTQAAPPAPPAPLAPPAPPAPLPVQPSAAPAPKLPPLQAKPGYIRGRTVFADGRPIPQFRVMALGWATEIHLGPTGTIPNLGQVEGNNGHYEFRPTSAFDRTKILSEALVSVVQATAHLSYKDRSYLLAMHPLDGLRDGDSKGGFSGKVSKGVVRDFVLKLHGPKIGFETNTPPRDTDTNEMGDRSFGAFYGGTVAFVFRPRDGGNTEPNPFKDAVMTLTFTPDGPLLDGSASRTVVRTLRIKDDISVTYSPGYFRDIPLGDYTLTATLTNPGGASYPMRLKKLGSDYQSSFAVQFEPWGTLGGVKPLNVYGTR